MIRLVRTHSEDLDFRLLVKQLDADLKITDGDEHDFYNQFNAIDSIKHVVVAYSKKQAVACGAFKEFNRNSLEIKRMFTMPEERGKGIATLILKELENWGAQLGYSSSILETGIRQKEAIALYNKNLYNSTPNYGQYAGVKNSLCFKKQIITNEKSF